MQSSSGHEGDDPNQSQADLLETKEASTALVTSKASSSSSSSSSALPGTVRVEEPSMPAAATQSIRDSADSVTKTDIQDIHDGAGSSDTQSAKQQTQVYLDPSAAVGDAGNDYSYDDLGLDDINFSTSLPKHGDDLLTESSDIDIRGLSVGERLYYIGCGMERNRQERLRQERENKILQELSEVTAKPMITSKARALPAKGDAFAEHSLLWRKRMEHEKRKQAARKQMEDVAETRKKVEVDPKSQAIIERGSLRHCYKGPVSGWNKHFARYQTKKNMVPEKEIFSPNINPKSTGLHRDGDIGDRLFDEAAKKEERLRVMVSKASRDELEDPTTGQPYFHPNPSSCTRSRSKGTVGCRRDIDTVVNNLLSKGQETQKKKDQMTHEHLSEKYTFQPKLNRRSQEMASRCRRPLYQPPTPAGKPSQQQQQQQHMQAKQVQPQFSHMYSDKRTDSSVGSQGMPSYCTKEFIRRNERLILRREEVVSKLKKEQEIKELEHCTFTPRICATSEDIFSQGQMISMGRRRSRSMDYHHHHPHQHHPHHHHHPSGMRSPGVCHTPRADIMPELPPHLETPTGGAKPEVSRNVLHGGVAIGEVDSYISSFEKEMMQVLEEWRKMEDV